MRFSVVLALFIVGLGVHAAPSQTVEDNYTALATATKLDHEGAQPFHLKLETQLFDLKGKPSETGTIEEWWLAPNQFRIEINAGTLHEVILTGEPDQTPPGVLRSAYLLRQLLTYTVSPLSRLSPALKVADTTRQISGHDLSCFFLQAAKAAPTFTGGTNYCRAPGDPNVRLIVNPDYMVVRNTTGKFGDTEVALDVTVSYLGLRAASGKVTLLQRFDPSAGNAPVLHVSSVYTTDPHVPSPAVTAGHRLSTPLPTYPLYAKHEHIGALVVLVMRITPQGKVGSADVIASSNDLFNDAAKDAVKSWLFSPFLLDGKPVGNQTFWEIRFNP